MIHNFTYRDISFTHKLDKAGIPTEEYVPHWHQRDELVFLLQGNVTYHVEGFSSKKTGCNELIYIRNSVRHYAEVDSTMPYERYVIHFPSSMIPEYLRKSLDEKGPFLHTDNKVILLELLEKYDDVFNKDEEYTLIQCEIIKLLVLLAHQSMNSGKENSKLVNDVIEYVDKNLGHPIDMKTLSDEFSYSKTYINNEFKRCLNMPTMTYIRKKKLIIAHKLITDGVSKSKAAELIGFENYSSFYRAYKNFSI